jgi:hypothetical protein
MYTKVNLNKPAGIAPGSAAQKNEIVLVEAQDLNFPASDGNGVKLIGVPTLKPGGKFITLYSTKSKTDAPFESDGDEDMINIAQKFVAQVPGNGLQLKEFVQNWIGKDVIIFHKSCKEDFYEVMGTPCAPLQLKPTKQDNNDGRMMTLTFEPYAKSGFVPKHYEGAIPFSAPVNQLDFNAVVINPNTVVHQLPAVEESIPMFVGSLGLDDGNYVTFIGGGGEDPGVIEVGESGQAHFLLKNGTTWTALSGSIIHFQVFFGGATKYLIELSRE